jgi:hypothetical protein
MIQALHIRGDTKDKSLFVAEFIPIGDIMEIIGHAFTVEPHHLPIATMPDRWEREINGQLAFEEKPLPPSVVPMDEQADKLDELAARGLPTIGPRPPHPLKEVGDQEQGAEYVGHTRKTAFFKSKVVPTMIAPDIYEKFPEPVYTRPRFGKSMYPDNFRHARNTTPGLPDSHLRWAVRDYLSYFEMFPNRFCSNSIH